MKYLGAELTDDLDASQHGALRREKMINSSFALKCIGIDCAQLQPKVRLFFYKTYCRPILWYATECFNMTSSEVSKYQTAESNTVKRLLHLSKHSLSTPLLYAFRLEKVQSRFDIMKLKFFVRLCNNAVTKTILEEQLRQIKDNYGKVEQGKWAYHLTEVLHVFQRNRPELHQEWFDALNTTILFDPDDSGAVTQSIQKVSLADLHAHASATTKELILANNKQFNGGTSDTIRYLLDGNNKQSYTLLKLYLKSFTAKN